MAAVASDGEKKTALVAIEGTRLSALKSAEPAMIIAFRI